ncbi:MAG: M48 metallopeptidase family protein [Shewanella sp.]
MAMLKYLAHYPESLQQQVQSLLDNQQLKLVLDKKYPQPQNNLRNDKALYQYTMALKNRYLKNAPPLAKVCFDDKQTLKQQALGLHTYARRQHGSRIKAKHEIRISGQLKQLPEALLHMVVVHELAHIKEKDHDKAFYQLCCHMEPDYHQLELDLRLFLTLQDQEQPAS